MSPLASREKNRASTSQEQRVSSQDSSFLRPKETEKKSQPSMSQETEETLVPPINVTDEEVLNRYESYRDNPGYYDGDNILINNTNMLSPSGGLFEVAGYIDSAGNIGSQKDPNPTQMKPTSGDVKNNSNQSYLIVEGSNVISDEPEMMPSISIDGIDLPAFFAESTEEDSQLPYDNLEGLGILGEGSGIDTTCLFKKKSSIAFGSFGSIESMMNAKREREKIVMIPTPTVNDAPQMIPTPPVNDAPTVNEAPQWTITKKQVKTDFNPNYNSLILQESSVDKHIRRHMIPTPPVNDASQMIPAPTVNEAPQWTITKKQFKNDINPNYNSLILQESSGYEHIRRHMIPTPTVNDAPQMIPAPTVNDAPQWTITRILNNSDIHYNYDTLVLQESSVDEHIRRHMPVAEFRKIVRNSGIVVDVYDYDLRTMHKLRLRLGKGRYYALTGGWFRDFIRRRSLETSDEIGFLWDSSASRLVFGVISRAQTKPTRNNYI